MRFILICGLALSSTAALAEGDSSSTSEPRTAKKDKVICVSETETGSMLRKRRICKTKQQWDDERRESRELLDRATRVQTNPQG